MSAGQDVFTRNRAVDRRIDKEINFWKGIKMLTVFEPIEDEQLSQEIEANTRTRNGTTVFMNNLNAFYAEWNAKKENEGKPFKLFLNKQAGDPFFTKKTDSLYSSLMTRLKDMELKSEWRLIKFEGHLIIAHL